MLCCVYVVYVWVVLCGWVARVVLRVIILCPWSLFKLCVCVCVWIVVCSSVVCVVLCLDVVYMRDVCGLFCVCCITYMGACRTCCFVVLCVPMSCVCDWCVYVVCVLLCVFSCVNVCMLNPLLSL